MNPQYKIPALSTISLSLTACATLIDEPRGRICDQLDAELGQSIQSVQNMGDLLNAAFCGYGPSLIGTWEARQFGYFYDLPLEVSYTGYGSYSYSYSLSINLQIEEESAFLEVNFTQEYYGQEYSFNETYNGSWSKEEDMYAFNFNSFFGDFQCIRDNNILECSMTEAYMGDAIFEKVGTL